MPNHGALNPDNSSQIWDANFGKYIDNPYANKTSAGYGSSPSTSPWLPSVPSSAPAGTPAGWATLNGIPSTPLNAVGPPATTKSVAGGGDYGSQQQTVDISQPINSTSPAPAPAPAPATTQSIAGGGTFGSQQATVNLNPGQPLNTVPIEDTAAKRAALAAAGNPLGMGTQSGAGSSPAGVTQPIGSNPLGMPPDTQVQGNKPANGATTSLAAPDGSQYDLQAFNGEYYAATDQGWVPWSVITGARGWNPGEQDLVKQLGPIPGSSGQSGGQPSGQPTTPPAAGTGTSTTGSGQPAIGASSGDTQGYGSLLQPWETPFTGSGTSGYTTAPFTDSFKFDYSDFANSPQFQQLMNQGVQSIERSAAAGGNLRGGRTLKELERFREGLVSSDYQQQYQNQLGEFNLKHGIFDENQARQEGDYNKSLNEYNLLRDIFQTNQDRTFNKLSAVSGTGQVAANSINNVGQASTNSSNQINLNSQAQINDYMTSAASAIAQGKISKTAAISQAISAGLTSAQLAILIQKIGGL